MISQCLSMNSNHSQLDWCECGQFGYLLIVSVNEWSTDKNNVRWIFHFSGPVNTNANITFQIQHPELLRVTPGYIRVEKDKPQHNFTILVTGLVPGNVEVWAEVNPKDALEYVDCWIIWSAHIGKYSLIELHEIILVSAQSLYEFWSPFHRFSFTYQALLVGHTLWHGRCHSIRKCLPISVVKALLDWISILFHWMWSDSYCTQHSTLDCITANTFRWVLLRCFARSDSNYDIWKWMNNFLYATLSQDEYYRRNPRGLNPVQLNDVFFSVHAFFATIFTIGQCLIYEVSFDAWFIQFSRANK